MVWGSWCPLKSGEPGAHVITWKEMIGNMFRPEQQEWEWALKKKLESCSSNRKDCQCDFAFEFFFI